jgi:hypothetical protein
VFKKWEKVNMSDDLVKRLRQSSSSDYSCQGCMDTEREEAADHIEKLEAALIDILKVPRSEASWGIALVIARHALKEEKKDD